MAIFSFPTMLQLNLSKTLSQDLNMHLRASNQVQQNSMQWYAHRVTILRRKCILAMEQHSRYCILFAGLTKPDFEKFPEIFVDRLWREAVSICQLSEQQSAQLTSIIHAIGKQQRYQIKTDRSVQTHINQAAEDIRHLSNHIVGRLPETGAEQFGCGIRINETLRKRENEKDYFVPINVFRDFWTGMLDFSERHKTQQQNATIS